ncbi:---NA---, partial [Paramuricea clavata]
HFENFYSKVWIKLQWNSITIGTKTLQDIIQMNMRTTSYPKEIQEPILQFSMATKRGMKTHTWDMKIVKKDGNEMIRNFQIQIPVVAAVGRYTIQVVLPKIPLSH